jgi:uncharacterized protein
LSKASVIRDPLHGYLVVAPHERQIVDHAVTQRLRRITQTGLAELVYPEARTSRLVHSLGAMHVVSRFFRAAIENASEEHLTKFFDELVPLTLESYATSEELEKFFERSGTLSALSTARWYCSHPSLKSKEAFLKGILGVTEAALRFAALFHDLGHLPFSHDLEYALKDYVGGLSRAERASLPKEIVTLATKEAPHEELGHRLADLVFRDVAGAAQTHVRLAFHLAMKILDEESPYTVQSRPRAGALAFLHSLIDGEIDADRADYLLRDGRALGLEFAQYDLERLTQRIVMHHDPELGFITAIHERGLVALESFLLSRSRSNLVLVRHHKVAQTAAALRYASTAAFGTDEGQRFLESMAGVLKHPTTPEEISKALRAFVQFDDYWWVEVLRSIPRNSSALLDACLELVLNRGRTLRSLWKRKGDLSEHVRIDLNETAGRFFARSDKIEMSDRRKRLLAQDVLLTTHKFKPYRKRLGIEDSVALVKSDGSIRPASAMSRIIKGLDQSWEDEIHLHAFGLFASNKTVDQERESTIRLLVDGVRA